MCLIFLKYYGIHIAYYDILSYELSCATSTPEDLSAVFDSSSGGLSFSPLTWMLCLSLNAFSSSSFVVSDSFNLLIRLPI